MTENEGAFSNFPLYQEPDELNDIKDMFNTLRKMTDIFSKIPENDYYSVRDLYQETDDRCCIEMYHYMNDTVKRASKFKYYCSCYSCYFKSYEFKQELNDIV